MEKIVKYLNQHISGQVFSRPNILKAYSRDQSVMEATPKLVAIPYSTEDIQFLVKFANDLAEKKYKLPVTVRGSGTSKTGACLGEGMIISTEKLNEVAEIDDHARLVRAQSGVTLEKLNAVLATYGLCLPIEANPKETIGGLISTFPTNRASKKYGNILYFTDRIEAVLSNGEIIQTTSYTPRGLKNIESSDKPEAKLYQEIDKLISENSDLLTNISERPRTRAGYGMIANVKEGNIFDLMPLFFGAEGTLGIITEVILRVEPIPRPEKHVLASFSKLTNAYDYMTNIIKLEPKTLEIFDARIFKNAASHGKELGLLEPLIDEGYYVLASFSDGIFSTNRKLRSCLGLGLNADSITAENNINSEDFKEIYTLVDSYLNDDDAKERPSLVDDFSIPSDHLVQFVKSLEKAEKTLKKELPIFGSFATNVYTVRPDFNLKTEPGRKQSMQFLRYFAKLVRNCGGSFTGGSSEGRVKGLVTTAELSPDEKKLYKSVKKAFDPYGVLNPGTKLGAKFADVVRHLRTSETEGIKS